jgi:hypothetical protein
MAFKTLFDDGHSRLVIGGNGVVMNAGIGQRATRMTMTQKRLNRGNPAAGVQELGGKGVAQLVWCDFDARSFAGSLDAAAQEIFAQRPVMEEKNEVNWLENMPFTLLAWTND